MTARVLPMRSLPQGKPCGSGTDPKRVTPACGRTPARLYPEGWRCEEFHKPRRDRRKPSGSIFDVPVRRVLEEVA